MRKCVWRGDVSVDSCRCWYRYYSGESALSLPSWLCEAHRAVRGSAEENHISLALRQKNIIFHLAHCYCYSSLKYFPLFLHKASLSHISVMPASLYQSNLNMERIQSSDLEDNRAVKLAYELAMLGLDNSSALSMESLSLNSHTLAQLEELKTRKSQNMTECVPVPTSEHVAEIVGRQGEYPLLISGVEGIQQKGKVLIFPWY